MNEERFVRLLSVSSHKLSQPCYMSHGDDHRSPNNNCIVQQKIITFLPTKKDKKRWSCPQHNVT